MDDPAVLDLADTARRLLASPVGPRLLVDGMGPRGARLADGVELVDRHGTPVLLCDPGAALAAVADGQRCATLMLGRQQTGTVQLRGRLQQVGRDAVEDREVLLVELRLESVRVRLDSAQDVTVPLADYHGRRDPHLASYAEALRRHTNDGHGAELRLFAARLSGVVDRAPEEMDPQQLVAVAELSRLEADGTVLTWVDLDGAHSVRLLFAHTATSCHELSEQLRHTLCPGS